MFLTLPSGPTEQYVNPIATSQDYGWQQVSEGIPAWAKNARHAHVNSEMTRLDFSSFFLFRTSLCSLLMVIHVGFSFTSLFYVFIPGLWTTCQRLTKTSSSSDISILSYIVQTLLRDYIFKSGCLKCEKDNYCRTFQTYIFNGFYFIRSVQ